VRRGHQRDAGPGALAASIDEIVYFFGNDFRRELKPLAESRWPTAPSPVVRIRMRCRDIKTERADQVLQSKFVPP
jgi:hypothetical protein